MSVRLLAAATLLIMNVAWASTAAHAHAVLVESRPADGQVLDAAPDRIELRFNEPVRITTLRLVDGAGRATALTAEAGGAPGAVSAALPPVGPGSYVVGWRLVSIDGHPVDGAILFAVGTGQSPSAAASRAVADAPAAIRATLPVAKAVACLGALAAAGTALFLLLFGRHDVVDPAAVGRIGLGAVGLATVASVAGVVLQGLLLGGIGPADLMVPAEAGRAVVLGVGPEFVPRFAGLVLLAVAMRAGRAARVIGVAGALAVAVSFTLTGHTAPRSSVWLSALLALHLLGAAFWIGSFWPLILATRRADRVGIERLMAAFSRTAMLAVPLLVVAGIAMGCVLVGGWYALVAAPYGRVLLAKSALVAGMLGLAAANRWRFVPALRTDASAPARLRRSIAAEAALAVAVIGVTAILTSLPPAAGHGAAAPQPQTVSRAVPTSEGSLEITLSVSPARPGVNVVELRIAGAGGAPHDVIEATARFQRPDLGIALARPMARTGPGRYRVEGPEMAVPGPWWVSIELLVTDFEKRVVRLPVTIGGGDSPGPRHTH